MDAGRWLLHHKMENPRRILMISGSLRRRSTNTALLLTAQAFAPPEAATVLYEGAAGLPHFNPDEDRAPLAQPVADLREQIRSADAVLFSTPEYAGALPGSFKNVLDWAVGDDQPGSMNGKPVAYVNVSPRGAALAHASLRGVLGYLGADIVEEACVDIPLTQDSLGEDGLIISEEIRREVTIALANLATVAGSESAADTCNS
jgi:chromate reductase